MFETNNDYTIFIKKEFISNIINKYTMLIIKEHTINIINKYLYVLGKKNIEIKNSCQICLINT